MLQELRHQWTFKTKLGQLVSISVHPVTDSKADINSGGPVVGWETRCWFFIVPFGALSQTHPSLGLSRGVLLGLC